MSRPASAARQYLADMLDRATFRMETRAYEKVLIKDAAGHDGEVFPDRWRPDLISEEKQARDALQKASHPPASMHDYVADWRAPVAAALAWLLVFVPTLLARPEIGTALFSLGYGAVFLSGSASFFWWLRVGRPAAKTVPALHQEWNAVAQARHRRVTAHPEVAYAFDVLSQAPERLRAVGASEVVIGKVIEMATDAQAMVEALSAAGDDARQRPERHPAHARVIRLAAEAQVLLGLATRARAERDHAAIPATSAVEALPSRAEEIAAEEVAGWILAEQQAVTEAYRRLDGEPRWLNMTSAGHRRLRR
ncbi:MAG: hypothetical protein QM655_12935 [Nocardioidaceae bacterium]